MCVAALHWERHHCYSGPIAGLTEGAESSNLIMLLGAQYHPEGDLHSWEETSPGRSSVFDYFLLLRMVKDETTTALPEPGTEGVSGDATEQPSLQVPVYLIPHVDLTFPGHRGDIPQVILSMSPPIHLLHSTSWHFQSCNGTHSEISRANTC